jgi:hypothetical protein
MISLRKRALLCSAFFGLAAAAGAAPAGAQTIFGSMSYSTHRSCATTASTANCDGAGSGQQIVTSSITGGANLTANSNLALTDGSFANGSVSFGALDLPQLAGETRAVGDVRMNSNLLGYQSYIYGGPSGTPFSLAGNLHIVDSSTNPTGGALPGGAIYSAYIAIWDPSFVAPISSAFDILNQFFYAPCGTPGVLAAGTIGGSLPGGEQNFGISTTSCSGSPLTLTTGQHVLAVAGLQIPVNRGGFADASSTFTVGLDPALPEESRELLTASLVSAQAIAAPEPGTWAMMLLGFGAVGFSLRRRRSEQPVLA